ncbi:MAG: hypothetical protein ACOYOP_03840 [Microthrixaceae bacterium]
MSTEKVVRRPRSRAAAAPAPRRVGPLDRLAVRPYTGGPRVRLGILWFLAAVAAATAGPWSSAVVWAVVAGGCAQDLVRVWHAATRRGDAGPAGWVAAAVAALPVLAAGAGPMVAGVVLVVAAGGAWVAAIGLGRPGPPDASVAIAGLLPALASVPVVLAVGSDTWAGLFLILAVSLYDAGSFLLGADRPGRLEGPLVGMIGVLAVTFTMASFEPPPFDAPAAWVVGAVVAVACPIGQWIMSAFLPKGDEHTRARRLDAYVLAAPLFLAGVWIAGGR